MTKKPRSTGKADELRALREQQAAATDAANQRVIDAVAGAAEERADAANPTQESSSDAGAVETTGGNAAADEAEPIVHIEAGADAEAQQRVLDAEVEDATWIGPNPRNTKDVAPANLRHAQDGPKVGQYVRAKCSTNTRPVVFMARRHDEEEPEPADTTRCIHCLAIIRGEPVPEHIATTPTKNGVSHPRRPAAAEAGTPGRQPRAPRPRKSIKVRKIQDVGLLLRKLKVGEKLTEEELAAAAEVLEARAAG